MSRSRSSNSITTGQLLLRLSIPLAILIAAAVGFYFVIQRMTANVSSGKGPSKVILYEEAEWIPDAVMGSLLPGRFEFEPGSDDVIVISKVTERRPLEESSIQRLWLQLPPDLEVGKPIDLVQLQSETHLGYDQGVYRKGIFAMMPKVDGTLTLRQRHANWLVVEVNGNLTTPDNTSWNLDGYHVAYLAPGGHHAQQTSGSKEASPVVPHAAPPPGAKVIGQWHGELVNDRGESGFEVYYQFNADGRFAHSTCRGGGQGTGYSAGMKYGTWKMHGNKLVMRVDIFVFDEPKNNDHMDHLQGQPLIVADVVPVDDTITFKGYLMVPGNHDLKIKRLRKTNVPDLFTHRPNADRKPGFFERPMPSPSEVVGRGVVAP